MDFTEIHQVHLLLTSLTSFFSMITVPLYDTLGADAIKHIINQTELRTVVCSKDKVKNLLHLKPSLPSLKLIICMDSVNEDIVKAAKEQGGKFWTLQVVSNRVSRIIVNFQFVTG
jgi:long-chain acyl-CoA synthetase